MKKFAIIGFIVALAIAGVFLWQHFKHPSDAQVRQMLPGTWALSWGDSAHSTNIVGVDGRYTCRITDPRHSRAIELEGTFQVTDGVLIDTVTKNSQPNSFVPSVYRGRIIRADGSEMIVAFTEGGVQTVHYRKVAP